MSAILYDYLAGSASVSGNTITAQTTGSSNTSAVSGEVPNGFTSGALGSNVFNGSGTVPYTPSALTGTVVVDTVQDNLNVGQGFGSTATVGGAGALADSITLLITPNNPSPSQITAGAEVTTGGLVDSNSLTAQYVGNASNNSISIQPGTNPTFNGSLAVSSISANYGDGLALSTPALDAATNTNSAIGASILDALTGGTHSISDTLSGSLTVAGNTISASATGNQALPPAGSTAAAGNLISIGGGENFLGTGSSGAPNSEASTITIGGPTTVFASSTTDLSLFNSQLNAGIDLVPVAFTSNTEGGSIFAVVDNLVNGSVTLGTSALPNAINSTATGNNASNAIIAAASSLGVTTSIAGTASLSSVQLNELAPVTANLGVTAPNSIVATVGAIATGSGVTTALVNNASVALTFNSLSAQAYGNVVTNTLDLAATTVAPASLIGPTTLTEQHVDVAGDSNSVATADATVNNVQRASDGSSVRATNNTSLIAINATGVTSPITASQLTNSLGEIQAAAIGNSASNGLSLSATSLSSTGGVDNLQTLTNVLDAGMAITATVSNPQIAINAGNANGTSTTTGPLNLGVSSSTLSITANLLQAFAAGNQATNSLSASGSSTVVTPSITPEATFTSLVNYNFTNSGGFYLDGSVGGRATVQGDYGLLTSQATNVAVTAQVTGTLAPVLITVGVGGTPGTGTPGNFDGSSAYANSNTIYATAIGNEIAPGGGNTLSLSANNLSQTPYSPLAGVANIQELGTGGSALANINTSGVGGAPLFEVDVGGNVGTSAGSTIQVSNDVAQALAEGNFSNNNTINLSGNSISEATPGTALTGLTMSAPGFPGGAGAITADLALTVLNAQTVSPSSSVTATVQTNTGGTSTGGYGALINVGGTTVANSSLTEANNVFLATAIDNNAQLNTINISGLTNLAISAGVQNLQFSAADASATLGVPGSPGTLGSPGTNYGTVTENVPSGDNEASFTGNTLTVTGNSLTLTGSAAAITYLEGLITVGTGSEAGSTSTSLILGPGTYTVSNPSEIPSTAGVIYLVTGSAVSQNFGLATSATPGSPPVPSSVAQIIAVNDPITNSALSITSAPGTTPSGATAISNNAVNTLSLSTNILTGSSGITAPNATLSGATNTLTAAADYAVQNSQLVVGTGPVATAYETLGITDFSTGTPTPYGITGSSLTIGGTGLGNALQAVSEGNVANNTLSLSVTDTGTPAPSGALLSAQYGAITVPQTALSVLTAYAPAAIGGLTSGTGSSVTISNNTNTALSVQNDVTNTLSVTGTNVGGLLVALSSYSGAAPIVTAAGSYSLNNIQYATGVGVVADATTSIANYDNLLTNTTGIINSSANFNDNVTTAESDANRATVGGGNSLTLTATNLSASGALVNLQNSSITSSATALSSAELLLNGGTDLAPAASSSTLSVSGNVTQSIAHGNIAYSTFVADGTANNGTGPDTALAQASVDLLASLTASAGGNGTTNNTLVNAQINSGAVTAISAGTNSITLAGGIGTGFASAGALDSTITLDNNMWTAEADGNVSSSSMTLTGTNLYNNGALSSVQTNTAAISASVTSVTSATITGGSATASGTSGSSIDVSGNQAIATARGNSASNSLNATPSANYGGGQTSASTVLNNTPGVSTVTASYALLNVQDNSGPVSASTTANNTVALNSAAGSPFAVVGSSVTVTGNVTQANAYGNTASNSMTLAALNTGNATAALGNTQVNSGAINASVTSSNNGLTVGTTGSNTSTFLVSGNSITARAVGNAAVNTIASK
jgi:hypothetical protein